MVVCSDFKRVVEVVLEMLNATQREITDMLGSFISSMPFSFNADNFCYYLSAQALSCDIVSQYFGNLGMTFLHDKKYDSAEVAFQIAYSFDKRSIF